jgi:hypothetical protein
MGREDKFRSRYGMVLIISRGHISFFGYFNILAMNRSSPNWNMIVRFILAQEELSDT